MYKFVTITAAIVIASTVHSLAQSAAPHDQHIINIENDGRSVFATSTGQRSYGVNLATQREVDGLRSAIRAERARIDTINTNTRGAQGEQGERGMTGATGETGAQGVAGRDGIDGTNGTNGIDGTNGARGAQGERGARGAKGDRGYRGEAGQDANTDAVFRGIAGATALNFANQGGAGLGFGLGSFEGQTAAAISVTYDFDPNASISFGASSGGNVGGGFKLKF